MTALFGTKTFGKIVHMYYVDIPETYNMGNQPVYFTNLCKMEDSRWQIEDGRVLCHLIICYTKDAWRSSKDCSSSGYEPSPLIHNCIFKGRLFKTQLHSNYLPLAVSSHASLTTGIAVLLSYDTILTLPAEIQFVWKSRIRLPSVLYIMARYSVLIECICSVVLDWTDGPLEHILAQIAQPRMDVRDITGKGLRYKQISEIPFNTDIVNISRRTLLPCGVLRFVIIFVWNLQSIITDKTPFLTTGANMERWQVFIAFMFSKFLMATAAYPPSSFAASFLIFVITTFRAAVHSIGNSLIEDVGDPNYTGNFIPSAPHEGELAVHSAEGCEEAYGGERVEGHGAR
ncbi:hypothetical protein BU17DRAFT_68610 [Hysterangium stoloniferum]|nr:hypothetical protein BU17DRAFT_68610 [Hysterangium stoloniferum]